MPDHHNNRRTDRWPLKYVPLAAVLLTVAAMVSGSAWSKATVSAEVKNVRLELTKQESKFEKHCVENKLDRDQVIETLSEIKQALVRIETKVEKIK